VGLDPDDSVLGLHGRPRVVARPAGVVANPLNSLFFERRRTNDPLR
jgi:hypothetical protein